MSASPRRIVLRVVGDKSCDATSWCRPSTQAACWPAGDSFTTGPGLQIQSKALKTFGGRFLIRPPLPAPKAAASQFLLQRALAGDPTSKQLPSQRMDGTNWRGGPGAGEPHSVGASPALKGELQQADQVSVRPPFFCLPPSRPRSRSRFNSTDRTHTPAPTQLLKEIVLYLYVPTEEVGVVIGTWGPLLDQGVWGGGSD